MSAVFSPCRTWRYTLTRRTGFDVLWPPERDEHGEYPIPMGLPRTVLFVCLNPSTADEEQDDPTVRRCIRFARDWGFPRLVVCNLFGLRSTDPTALYSHPDPIGESNGAWTLQEAMEAKMVVIAWGNHGRLRGRGDEVRKLLGEVAPGKVYALGFNASGEPKHPLYLRADTVPVKL